MTRFQSTRAATGQSSAAFIRMAIGILAVTWASAAGAQPKEGGTPPGSQTPAAAPPAEAPQPPGILQELRDQAAAVRPLVKTDAAKAFLDATSRLPLPGKRTVWRDKDKRVVVSMMDYRRLPPEKKAGLTARECDARFYYTTGYGTPLVYARPLDLLAERAGVKTWAGMKICDFGYGTIGHLRLLALNGADVTGVDVEPMFPVLYGEPGDTGEIAGIDAATGKPRSGHITLVSGRWPAEETVRKGVAAAAASGTAAAVGAAPAAEAAPTKTGEVTPGFDVFISKNTLKRGYIHPSREVDEKFLVKLGVDDEAFVKAVHDALKPGGWFMIYNLSPKQNPDDKPYLPHADGQMPFPKEMLEKAGFEVLVYDQEDRDAAVEWWRALGIAEGKSEEEVREDLFAWWMVARKK